MSITNNYNVILEGNNNLNFPGRLFIDQIQLVNYGSSSECFLTADTDGKLLANGTDAFGDPSETVLPLANKVTDYNSKNIATVSCKILTINSTDNNTQTDLRIDDNGHLVINGLLTTVGAAVDFVDYPATTDYSYDNYLPGILQAQFVRVVSGNGLHQVVFTADEDGNLLLNGNVPASAPANTVLPAVTGNALVGSTVTTTDGTWTGAPPITYTVQWYRYDDNTGANPILITGATNHTYVLQSADNGKYIRSKITATDDIGAIAVYSNYTSQVKTPVVNTVAPAITGTEIDGSILTCSAGTYTGNVVGLTYQWYRANADHSSPVAISGETGTTHVLDSNDVGKTLKCVVTCNGFYGSQVVTNSNWTGTISPAGTGYSYDDMLTTLGLTHDWPLGDVLDDIAGTDDLSTLGIQETGASLINNTVYAASTGRRLNVYKQIPTDTLAVSSTCTFAFVVKTSSQAGAGPSQDETYLKLLNGGVNEMDFGISKNYVGFPSWLMGLQNHSDFVVWNNAVNLTDTFLVIIEFNATGPQLRVSITDGVTSWNKTQASVLTANNYTMKVGPGVNSELSYVQRLVYRNSILTTGERNDLIAAFTASVI